MIVQTVTAIDYLDAIVSRGLDDEIGNDTRPGLYNSLSFDPNTQKHHNWALHATDNRVKTVLQVACPTYLAAVLYGKKH